MQNAVVRKNIEDKNFLVVKIKTKTGKALIAVIYLHPPPLGGVDSLTSDYTPWSRTTDTPPSRVSIPYTELAVFASCPRIIATFPALSQLAVRLLLLPIGTATCERSFSAMNRPQCSKRSQLTAEHLEQLMFISHKGPKIPHPRLVGAAADQAQNSYDDFVRQVHEHYS